MVKKKAIKARNRKVAKEDSKKTGARYFAISDLDSTMSKLRLITPEMEYTIVNNRVTRTIPVGDYETEVRTVMNNLAEISLVGEGFYVGEYRIQFNRDNLKLGSN